jgi:hypothetical protein
LDQLGWISWNSLIKKIILSAESEGLFEWHLWTRVGKIVVVVDVVVDFVVVVLVAVIDFIIATSNKKSLGFFDER